jgi:hypothetical protein
MRRRRFGGSELLADNENETSGGEETMGRQMFHAA